MANMSPFRVRRVEITNPQIVSASYNRNLTSFCVEADVRLESPDLGQIITGRVELTGRGDRQALQRKPEIFTKDTMTGDAEGFCARRVVYEPDAGHPDTVIAEVYAEYVQGEHAGVATYPVFRDVFNRVCAHMVQPEFGERVPGVRLVVRGLRYQYGRGV